MEFTYTLTEKDLETLSQTSDILFLVFKVAEMGEEEAALRILKNRTENFQCLVFNIKEKYVSQTLRAIKEDTEEDK